jgi:integrase
MMPKRLVQRSLSLLFSQESVLPLSQGDVFLSCPGSVDLAILLPHLAGVIVEEIAVARKRRLTVLRQFFRFARSRKVILAGPPGPDRPRVTGQTLLLNEQRELYRRWTTGRDAHPHEALLGILALLHGASSDEVRRLRVSDIDQAARTVGHHESQRTR